MLVYVFRELVRYSTNSFWESGQCFLQMQSSSDLTKLFLSFWAGNVCNHLLLTEVTPNLLDTKKILEVIDSFLAVPSSPPVIFSLLGLDARSAKSLKSELSHFQPSCIVPTFRYEYLYKVIPGSSVKILHRFELHSVLQFLPSYEIANST